VSGLVERKIALVTGAGTGIGRASFVSGVPFPVDAGASAD
jgi:NAD(P)-dependent dehydrogenase (short-subunit alcohol dehydrogenase family)